MEYRGTFENGVIRPDDPLDLPDGTPVEFHPVAARNGPGPGAIGGLSDAQVREMQNRFWNGKDLDELVAESGAGPVRSADDFHIPGLTDEDMDALDQIIRERRAR